jgi:hypothetical protein
VADRTAIVPPGGPRTRDDVGTSFGTAQALIQGRAQLRRRRPSPRRVPPASARSSWSRIETRPGTVPTTSSVAGSGQAGNPSHHGSCHSSVQRPGSSRSKSRIAVADGRAGALHRSCQADDTPSMSSSGMSSDVNVLDPPDARTCSGHGPVMTRCQCRVADSVPPFAQRPTLRTPWGGAQCRPVHGGGVKTAMGNRHEPLDVALPVAARTPPAARLQRALDAHLGFSFASWSSWPLGSSPPGSSRRTWRALTPSDAIALHLLDRWAIRGRRLYPRLISRVVRQPSSVPAAANTGRGRIGDEAFGDTRRGCNR